MVLIAPAVVVEVAGFFVVILVDAFIFPEAGVSSKWALRSVDAVLRLLSVFNDVLFGDNGLFGSIDGRFIISPTTGKARDCYFNGVVAA